MKLVINIENKDELQWKRKVRFDKFLISIAIYPIPDTDTFNQIFLKHYSFSYSNKYSTFHISAKVLLKFKVKAK